MYKAVPNWSWDVRPLSFCNRHSYNYVNVERGTLLQNYFAHLYLSFHQIWERLCSFDDELLLVFFKILNIHLIFLQIAPLECTNQATLHGYTVPNLPPKEVNLQRTFTNGRSY